MSGRKRGRPPAAAQSLDEALSRHFAGESPKRPRNDFERQVMSKGRDGKRGGGRLADPASPTRLAAELAAYIVSTEGIPIREATRRAAVPYGVKAESFRRLAAHLLKGPQSTVRATVNQHDRQLTGGATAVSEGRPLLARIETVNLA